MSKFFRHKTISSFKVGRFQFKNHIAEVGDDDYPDFLKEYEGLQGVDQVNITEVLNIQNERPVQRVIRGSLDALNTVDSGNHMTRASDMRNEGKEQALRQKQAELDARENELNERLARLEADEVARQAPVDGDAIIGQASDSVGDSREQTTTLDAALGNLGPDAGGDAPVPSLNTDADAADLNDKAKDPELPGANREAPGTDQVIESSLAPAPTPAAPAVPTGIRLGSLKPVDAR